MNFGDFLYGLFGQAIWLAALAYLLKALISSSLAREVRTHKAQLDLENVAFKSQLEVVAHRQTTVFSRLHEQRAELIAEVYAKLAQAVRALRQMVAPFQMAGGPSYQQLLDASAKSIEVLETRLDEVRVWFAQDTCSKGDAVLSELRNTHNHFALVVKGGRVLREGEADSKEWSKSWERVEKVVPALKTALENDFRGILGVASIPEEPAQPTARAATPARAN